ncbi:MAG: hypothetical protein COA69_12965 [Robiginitomaculum sp.]|nr:MAG: hypothetical protein COA69_12965 [Robiginitomaculum sp.]
MFRNFLQRVTLLSHFPCIFAIIGAIFSIITILAKNDSLKPQNTRCAQDQNDSQNRILIKPIAFIYIKLTNIQAFSHHFP